MNKTYKVLIILIVTGSFMMMVLFDGDKRIQPHIAKINYFIRQIGNNTIEQQLEDGTRELQLEDRTRKQQLEDRTREQQLEDRTREQQLEDRTREQQLEDRTREQRLEDRTRELQLEDRTRDQQLEDRTREQQLEDRSRGQQLEDRSRDQQLEDRTRELQLEDRSRDQQLEDRTREQQLGNKTREQRLEDRSREQQLEDRTREQRLEDRSRELQLEDRSRDQQLEGRTREQQLGNKTREQQLEDRTRKQQLGNKTRELQLEDRSREQQLEDRSREQQLEDRTRKQQLGNKTREQQLGNKTPENMKSITYVNFQSWMNRPENPFKHCNVSACTIKYTNDLKYVNVSDAVILYGVAYNPLFKRVKQNQVWILLVQESPIHAHINHFKKLRNQINWTITYRLDSDFPIPYGFTKRTNKPVQKNYTQILSQKTKLAAWIVSHCSTQSKREVYVKLLQKHVPVDIFGKCGPNGTRSDARILFPLIEKTYKFYLSFENSLCRDYVTEKFFIWQNKSIVPVVRGSANYSHFYPKGSYIDVNDFKSVTELADYLLYLDKNDGAYIEYLKAKEMFITVPPVDSACEICERLHNLDKYRKIYKDVYDWYTNGMCTQPKDLNL